MSPRPKAPMSPGRKRAEGKEPSATPIPKRKGEGPSGDVSVEFQSPTSGPGGNTVVNVLLREDDGYPSCESLVAHSADERERQHSDESAPTLKPSASDSVLEVKEDHLAARTKKDKKKRFQAISWDNRVIVESLVVPICPEHGQKTMTFQKGRGDGVKSVEVEFSDLVDWVKESRALGASCKCSQCGAHFGMITKNVRATTAPASKLSPWSCFGCELEVPGVPGR